MSNGFLVGKAGLQVTTKDFEMKEL